MRDQEIIGLWEAYQQVHAQPQEEVEQLDEISRSMGRRAKEYRRDQAQAAHMERVRDHQEKMKNDPKYREEHERLRTVHSRRNNGGEDQKESVDLFDYLLEYLVAEGYADTNKAALVIMANMSEEWKQSIVEEIGIVGPPKKAIDKIPGVRDLRIGLANSAKRSDYPASYSSQDIPMAGKHVIPTERSTSQSTFAKTRPSGKGPVGYKDISGD